MLDPGSYSIQPKVYFSHVSNMDSPRATVFLVPINRINITIGPPDIATSFSKSGLYPSFYSVLGKRILLGESSVGIRMDDELRNGHTKCV